MITLPSLGIFVAPHLQHNGTDTICKCKGDAFVGLQLVDYRKEELERQLLETGAAHYGLVYWTRGTKKKSSVVDLQISRASGINYSSAKMYREGEVEEYAGTTSSV